MASNNKIGGYLSKAWINEQLEIAKVEREKSHKQKMLDRYVEIDDLLSKAIVERSKKGQTRCIIRDAPSSRWDDNYYSIYQQLASGLNVCLVFFNSANTSFVFEWDPEKVGQNAGVFFIEANNEYELLKAPVIKLVHWNTGTF